MISASCATFAGVSGMVPQRSSQHAAAHSGPRISSSISVRCGARWTMWPGFDRDEGLAETQIDYLPMFLMGLRTSWYEGKPANQELLRKFHAVYQEALAYMFAHQQETAAVLGEKRTHASADFVVEYLRDYPDIAEVTYVRDYKDALRKLNQELLPPA